MCLFFMFSVPYSFVYCSFVVLFESRAHGTSNIVLFFSRLFWLAFHYCCCCLLLYTNLRIVCSSSVKNEYYIELEIALGCINILMTLKLPIYEHSIPLHLSVSSSFSFIVMSYWYQNGVLSDPWLNLLPELILLLPFQFKCFLSFFPAQWVLLGHPVQCQIKVVMLGILALSLTVEKRFQSFYRAWC